MKDEGVSDSTITKEAMNLNLVYDLDVGSQNYDSNAVEHRVRQHSLKTEIVDTCGTAVDSTFTSIEVAVQPNYAIGVFEDNKLMLTPLSRFQQVRPSFDHVDEERTRRTIQTKDQMQRDHAAANKLTRVGLQGSGARGNKKDPTLIGTEWQQLQVFDQESAQSEAVFAKLSQFNPVAPESGRLGPIQAAKSLTQLGSTQYAEMLAPYDQVDDFSTSSLVKELGNNLTSERLAQMSIEGMIDAILAKSGIVSYSRALRIIKDALTVRGNSQSLVKEEILTYLFAQSAHFLTGTQSFIAKSSLVFEKSRRKSSIRDAVIVQLIKNGSIDVEQLMIDAKCDFKILGPIIESVANLNKRTREFSLKTFPGEEIDQEAEPVFEQ